MIDFLCAALYGVDCRGVYFMGFHVEQVGAAAICYLMQCMAIAWHSGARRTQRGMDKMHVVVQKIFRFCVCLSLMGGFGGTRTPY